MSSIILQAAVRTRFSVGASSENTGDHQSSGIAVATESYIATDDLFCRVERTAADENIQQCQPRPRGMVSFDK